MKYKEEQRKELDDQADSIECMFDEIENKLDDTIKILDSAYEENDLDDKQQYISDAITKIQDLLYDLS